MKWTEPAFVELLGHYLVALGPFLKYHTDAVGSVINKLFELLTSLPFVVKVCFIITVCMFQLVVKEISLDVQLSTIQILAGSFNKYSSACKIADLYIIYSNSQSSWKKPSASYEGDLLSSLSGWQMLLHFILIVSVARIRIFDLFFCCGVRVKFLL